MIASCPQVVLGGGIREAVLLTTKSSSLSSKFSTLNMKFFVIGRTLKFTIEILTFLINKISSTAVPPTPHTQNILAVS